MKYLLQISLLLLGCLSSVYAEEVSVNLHNYSNNVKTEGGQFSFQNIPSYAQGADLSKFEIGLDTNYDKQIDRKLIFSLVNGLNGTVDDNTKFTIDKLEDGSLYLTQFKASNEKIFWKVTAVLNSDVHILNVVVQITTPSNQKSHQVDQTFRGSHFPVFR